jgi:hypothetical protein
VKEVSTYHLIRFKLYTQKISGIYMVLLIYLRGCFSFNQSSSSGFCTLLVGNALRTVYSSGIALKKITSG